MTTRKYSETETVARQYYNSKEADEFYYNIWGGEDIHIGIYDDPNISISSASRKTVELMSSHINFHSGDLKLIDLGAGYGGAARYLVNQFECSVVCLNISEEQNNRNRKMNKDVGLSEKIEVVDGSFESIPFEDNSFAFVWSQDAILHSSDREKVFKEIHRILKKGGELIFTDPMQKEGVSKESLQPVLDRIHLSSMGSFEYYEKIGKSIGFEKIKIVDLTENLGKHYSSVLKEVESRYEEIIKISNKEYIDRMKIGLKNWIDAKEKNLLSWGILQFKKI
ncbi:MAG: methyltransferase domain-containing protein [Leptospiraceae bacterium]|nr:methyltransferase domain-containing protein [Leptospiraceae bacterium]